MKLSLSYRHDHFWTVYFLIRLFYLVFTVYVYSRFTIIGDSYRYMSAAGHFSPAVFINSTAFMDFTGGLLGRFLGGWNVVSNLPATIFSFFVVKWAVKKLRLRECMNNWLLLAIISLPSFCIWSSVYSKEIFGVFFSAVLGVMIVNYMRGDYKVRWRDLLGMYVCLLFKPQYLPFIIEVLLFLRIAGIFRRSPSAQLAAGLLLIALNIGVLIKMRDTVNRYAEIMPYHFISYEAGSNREATLWQGKDAVYKKAPWGMFTAFVGPTPGEMCNKPAMLAAGLESYFILFLFLLLAGRLLARTLLLRRFPPSVIVGVFLLFTGIAFIHYPFGIFNPGAAIRYRTNFVFLFIIVLSYLFCAYGYWNRTESGYGKMPEPHT